MEKILHLEKCNENFDIEWEKLQETSSVRCWKNASGALDLYHKLYWPKLENFVISLLSNGHENSFSQISYEELQNIVYNCVRNNHAEMLYRHLMDLINSHLQQFSKQLLSIKADGDSLETKCKYINHFHATLKLYGKALQGIVPVFSYMNRMYVAAVLESNLENQLLDLYKNAVVSVHGGQIIDAMKVAKQVPFAVDPAVMSELANALHSMAISLRLCEAEFFSNYIPNARCSSRPEDLEKEIENVKLLQLRLQNEGTFKTTNTRKRDTEQINMEDAECSNSMLASMLMGFRS